MTIDEHIAAAAVNDQVAIEHAQYGTGGNRVNAGIRSGHIISITETDVVVSSSVRGAPTATVPRSAIISFAAARGWRNA